MATYKSNLKFRNRTLYEGKAATVGGRVFIPAGTVLATGDKLYFGQIGENQLVKKVSAFCVGDAGATTVSIGFDQILDKAGDPVVVERLGPLGESDSKFTSPATNATAYAAAAVLTTPREVLSTLDTKLPGPVWLSATVATGATLAADIEVFINATVDGEISTKEVHGNDPDASYLLENV